jgi:hypothetical protein
MNKKDKALPGCHEESGMPQGGYRTIEKDWSFYAGKRYA